MIYSQCMQCPSPLAHPFLLFGAFKGLRGLIRFCQRLIRVCRDTQGPGNVLPKRNSPFLGCANGCENALWHVSTSVASPGLSTDTYYKKPMTKPWIIYVEPCQYVVASNLQFTYSMPFWQQQMHDRNEAYNAHVQQSGGRKISNIRIVQSYSSPALYHQICSRNLTCCFPFGRKALPNLCPDQHL